MYKLVTRRSGIVEGGGISVDDIGVEFYSDLVHQYVLSVNMFNAELTAVGM